MPAFNSAFNEKSTRDLCGCALLPIKTLTRGPALPGAPADEPDIVDETITLFRANVFFRNFEVKGNADRLLVYLTLYVTQCLRNIEKGKYPNKDAASKGLKTLAVDNFPLPGDAGWTLSAIIPASSNRKDKDDLKNYLKQLREEVGLRLIPRLYTEGSEPNKFWMSFVKKDFMNLKLDK